MCVSNVLLIMQVCSLNITLQTLATDSVKTKSSTLLQHKEKHGN